METYEDRSHSQTCDLRYIKPESARQTGCRCTCQAAANQNAGDSVAFVRSFDTARINIPQAFPVRDHVLLDKLAENKGMTRSEYLTSLTVDLL